MDNKTHFEIDKNGIPSYLKKTHEKQNQEKKNIELKEAYIPQSDRVKIQQKDPETVFQHEVQNLIDDLQNIEFDTVEDGYDTQEVDPFIKLTISSKLPRLNIDDSLIEMIEEHEFEHKKSGYDPVQVDNYLDSVCMSIEELIHIRYPKVVKIKQIETRKKRNFGDYDGYNYRKYRNLPKDK